MITSLMAIYLGGWVVITTTALSVGRVFADETRPPTTRLLGMTSVIAGAIWPILLLGVAEIGSIVTYAKLHGA